MSGVLQAKLWYAQRISAMVLGLCVAIHLLIIFYAIRGGLSAQEILGRTQGNIGFAIFMRFLQSPALSMPPLESLIFCKKLFLKVAW
jgi:succinate dehydrogenase hydrophobic anchor subunit